MTDLRKQPEVVDVPFVSVNRMIEDKGFRGAAGGVAPVQGSFAELPHDMQEGLLVSNLIPEGYVAAAASAESAEGGAVSKDDASDASADETVNA